MPCARSRIPTLTLFPKRTSLRGTNQVNTIQWWDPGGLGGNEFVELKDNLLFKVFLFKKNIILTHNKINRSELYNIERV